MYLYISNISITESWKQTLPTATVYESSIKQQLKDAKHRIHTSKSRKTVNVAHSSVDSNDLNVQESPI